MSPTTMTMAPTEADSPPEDRDRDRAIAALVNHLGWSSSRVGPLFGMSDRHARRIAQDVRSAASVATPTSPETAEDLTAAEARTMLRDYASDPYTRPEEREAAMGWMAVYAQASGVAELEQIKFRKGIRFPAKARNSYGERPRVGQA